MAPCPHDAFYTDCTSTADRVGFKRPSAERRIIAASTTGQKRRDAFTTPEGVMMDEETFPGPLVLPSDFLTQLDPDTSLYHQPCRAWRNYTARNSVEEGRKNIFVIPPPVFDGEAGEEGESWSEPLVPESNPGLPKWTASSTQMKDLKDYLSAFYSPMVIQQSKMQLKWRPFKGEPPIPGQMYISLEVPTIRQPFPIKCRPGKDGLSRIQIHAPDLLYAVMHRMPPLSHATVLLVDFDLYDLIDDANNNFTVTKAYGADRIVLVSTFREHPTLDELQEVDREHMWPASHCKAYVDGLIARHEEQPQPAMQRETSSNEPPQPEPALGAAIKAYKRAPEPKTTSELADVWFSRVAFTVSRGLGYCFGMEHCSYYACLMQGVSSTRQQSHIPPYLCPVCLTKLSWAVGPLLGSGARINLQRRWIKEQATSLKEFCGRRNHVAQFLAFEAWLGKRIEGMGN
ncbi:hypothetical protein ACHAPT_004672 [Fusarium lateritium]